MALPTPTPAPIRHRCFVTSIEVDHPEINRFAATITLRADHGPFTACMFVSDGGKYRVGDPVWVTITEGDLGL